ncbi:MAG: DNA translocase FtsK [Sphaerochaetaceae bacterium]
MLFAFCLLFVRKRLRHWWWLPPYCIGIYYTVFLYSRLWVFWKYGGVPKDIRPSMLTPLASNAAIGLIIFLFILIFLLETVIFVLFTYLTFKIRKKYHNRLKMINAKLARTKTGPEASDEAVVEEQPVDIKDPTKKEIRKAQKERRKMLQQERKRREQDKKETDEETTVTLAREPHHQEPSMETTTIDPEAPLQFPPIPDMPEFKTIGKTEATFPVEIEKKVFVGSVKVVDEDKVVLTETPVDEDEIIAPPEVQSVRKPYNPMASLRKKMAEDALSQQIVSPSELPHQKEVDIVEEEKELLHETLVAPTIENPKHSDVKDTKVKPAPVEPEQQEEEVDIEVAAGIGGLVSSNAGLSALLSRSKLRYEFPPDALLVEYPDHSTDIDEDSRKAGENLINTLAQFKIEATLVNIVKGPTVTMYEVSPAPGVRVSAITSLSDNIALQLAAQQVRIVAPIPGKQAVGIEVPNKARSIIGFREMLPSIDIKHYNVPMVLGKTITGDPVVIDLTATPHLLIAGATGSGKSVCVNSLISSILYRKSPKEVRLILVDPKIVELRIYNDIPHLLTPVITEAKKTIKALEFCQYEMQRRYKLLNALAVRNLPAYNKKIEELKLAREKLPYIVVVIDEFADLMVTVGKELETLLARLAAMARAVGIHLVLATQRPSANVITGIIKSNIPARIAFMVAGQIDSRIIIDEQGAEKLLGKGDMLFVSSWNPNSIRIQGAFMSDEEVERVVGFAKQQGEPDYLDEAFFEEEEHQNGDDDGSDMDGDSDDALMEKALKIVVERQSASASYLQRRLKIGYNRAARLVEQMEEDGYVGPARGSKPRELLRYPD